MPASTRSAMGSQLVPCSEETPSMQMVDVPAPVMRAPMELRKAERSTISGSLAAFSMTVIPRAFTAASMMLTVAPTDTMSR